MAKQSKAQTKTVERVMHAFKEGALERRDGEPVKDRKQAIAIALSEAGASDDRRAKKTGARRTSRTPPTPKPRSTPRRRSATSPAARA